MLMKICFAQFGGGGERGVFYRAVLLFGVYDATFCVEMCASCVCVCVCVCINIYIYILPTFHILLPITFHLIM